MKKIVIVTVLGSLISLMAQAAQRVETVIPNVVLDGVAAECESQQDILSAKVFFKDSKSTTGIAEAYVNTDMRQFSQIEKQTALRVCRLLVNLAEQNKKITLLQGFNYEGPGPVVGFRVNAKEYLLPQVSK